METRREKAIKNSVELMFSGVDQEDLKAVILAIALNKSEEERDNIAEQIRIAKEKDLADIMQRYTVNPDEPMEAQVICIEPNKTKL